MIRRIAPIVFAASLAFVFGCKTKSVDVNKQSSQKREWPQKCKMCGTEWLVTNFINPDEVVPLTVEWCFHDGAYCEDGLAMIMEQHKKGKSQDLERRWLNHCFSCKGCRCAAFEPDEWHKIVSTVVSLRNKSATEVSR